MGSKGQKFKSYTAEEKLKVVKQHLQNHISTKCLGKQTGINSGLICKWVKQYCEKGISGLESHRGNPFATLHTSNIFRNWNVLNCSY